MEISFNVPVSKAYHVCQLQGHTYSGYREMWSHSVLPERTGNQSVLANSSSVTMTSFFFFKTNKKL